MGFIMSSWLLTGWLLVVGVLLPLGIVGTGADAVLFYRRIYLLASTPVGRLVILALVALPAVATDHAYITDERWLSGVDALLKN